MRGIPWRLLGLGIVTALLLDLPFPLAGPLPLWRTVFAWFALVPLLVGVLGFAKSYPGHRRRWRLVWSFVAGWLSGAVWFGVNCYWVYDTMHLYGGLNQPLAVLALVLFSLYLGFWFGAFALVLATIQAASQARRLEWMPLVAVPFLWTATEFALARIPEFPWDLLGYSQVDNPVLTQLAPWVGVYGISFVLASANALLAAGMAAGFAPQRRDSWSSARRISGLCGVVLVLLGMAGIFVKPPAPAAPKIAVLVQPNLDVANDDVWSGPEWDRHLAEFARQARETCQGGEILGMPQTGAPTAAATDCSLKPPPSLIAWPESPAPFREEDPRFQASMAAIARDNQAPMIVGAVGIDLETGPDQVPQYHVYNSASIIAQDGHLAGRYDKIHLVPFGEYVPLRNLFFFLHKVTQTMPDMSTGTERKVFRLSAQGGAAHRYGAFICYESVFGDEIRNFARLGAEALVNISDDGWYGDTSAPWQHLNMARMRAIENRRWILRDTNNGVTASIDPYGTVRQSIPRHQVGALAAQFGYSSELTFYTVHGDLLAGICAILTVALLVWSVRVLLAEIAAKSPSRSMRR